MSCCDTETEKLAATGRILLAGQPNAGKTSVFNALTGASQRVGNWPGVTVERKEGFCRFGPEGLAVIDIPGTYSLETASLDEAVAREAIASLPDAVIVNVVDATLLERQLSLSLELLGLGRPMVLALTMLDEAEAAGKVIDREALSVSLGLPVLGIDGRTGKGAREVVSAALEEARRFAGKPAAGSLSEAPLTGGAAWGRAGRGVHAALAAVAAGHEDAADAAATAAAARARQARELGRKATKTTDSSARKSRAGASLVDSLALSPLAGPLLFLLVVFGMFQLTFGLGNLIVGWLETGLDAAGGLAGRIAWQPLASFVQGAILGGVGNVVLLVPYVFLMFLILSFLEDSGYMARAVFATDALMRRIGLNGKAFIPLVMGFGCNVPAIMAIRTIESPRDRLRATLMVPFTSCSARLPVYVAVAGAFFGTRAGLVIFSLYLAGMAAGIATAALSARFLPPEPGSGLVMELPPYRLPLARNLLLASWNRTKDYLVKAGTVIFAASAVLWLLSNLPWGAAASGSLVGRIGQALAPLFAPLGFDWRITVGLVSGVAAKEIVISTLGLLAAGSGGQGGPGSLSSALPSMMGPATALAFLVFTLLYTPCLATIAAMRTETGSRKWTAVSVAWSLALAYLVAFATRSVAMLLGLPG